MVVAGAFPRAVPVLAPGIERSEWPEERLRIAATLWASSYETSAELVDLGMGRSITANLTKKAAVSFFDPESAIFRAQAFHHATAEGVLSVTFDCERLFG